MAMTATINTITPSENGYMVSVTFIEETSEYRNDKNFSFNAEATEQEIIDSVTLDGQKQQAALNKANELQSIVGKDIHIEEQE